VELDWTTPTDNGGSAITGYKVFRSDSEFAQVELPNSSGSDSQITFTDNEFLLHGLDTIDASIITFAADYTSGSSWTVVGSHISITGGYAYMNNGGSSFGDFIHTPIGSTLSDDKWVAEFEYYNMGAINFYPFVLAAGTSLVGDNSVNQDFIAMSESNPNMLQLRYKDGSSNIVSSSNSNTMSTSTPYYLTMIRDGQDLSLKIYTDSDRTSQFGSTLTLTISGTVSGLTTLHHSGLDIGGGTSGYNFKVRGTKIYNGVTTPPAKPTNVQDNSILVEKDTVKRYWLTGESAFTPEQLVYDSSTGIYTSGGGESDAGINIKAGSVFIGKTISQVSFYLKQEVNPVTENLVYCRLYRSGAYVHTFGTTDPDNITVGSFGWYSFGTSGDADAGNGSVTLEEGDRILVSWDRGGAYNDTALRVGHSTSDVHDGTATNFIKLQSGTWTEYDAKDACFKIVGTTPAIWTVAPKTPAEIGDLLAHYDATVGVTASSNSVSAWADQSGNGNTLSSVSNPTRVEASLNGKDYLDFNSSKSMRATGLSETAPRPCSMVAVINPRSAGSQTIIRWSQSQYLSLKQDPTNTYFLSGGTSLNLTDSTLDDSWNAFFMDFKSNADGGTLQINIDTANAVSGDIGTNGTSGTTATLHVGINADNNNWYGNCRYAEIIIFDKVLTAYEKEQLYAHLKTKWGLP
jgi:hypothetical protein